MDAALADSVFLDVTGRTAKRLLELAGDGDEFELPITQEELAGMVGASRERVNKAIASFVRLGWIEQSDRRYRITNRAQARPTAPADRPRTVNACVPRIGDWGSQIGGEEGHGRRQASAASAARCAGRLSSWTKPWSAPS